MLPTWRPRGPQERITELNSLKVLFAVLDATRRRSTGLDKAREQYLNDGDAQLRVAKLAVALHDSALREALHEVEAAGALLAHARRPRRVVAGGEAQLPEPLAALAWSEDAEAALHANFAAHLSHASNDDLPEPDWGSRRASTRARPTCCNTSLFDVPRWSRCS